MERTQVCFFKCVLFRDSLTDLPVQYSLVPGCGTVICRYTIGLASRMFSSWRYRDGVCSWGVPRDLAPLRRSDVSISEKTAALSKRARFPSKSKSVSRPSSMPSPKHSSSLCFICPFFTPFFFGVAWFAPLLLDDPVWKNAHSNSTWQQFWFIHSNTFYSLLRCILLHLQELCLRRNPFGWPGTSRWRSP